MFLAQELVKKEVFLNEMACERFNNTIYLSNYFFWKLAVMYELKSTKTITLRPLPNTSMPSKIKFRYQSFVMAESPQGIRML